MIDDTYTVQKGIKRAEEKLSCQRTEKKDHRKQRYTSPDLALHKPLSIKHRWMPRTNINTAELELCSKRQL